MNMEPVTQRYVIISGTSHGTSTLYFYILACDELQALKNRYDMMAPQEAREGIFTILWDREENRLLYASNINPCDVDPDAIRNYLTPETEYCESEDLAMEQETQ